MSSDNFHFVAKSGKKYPNLSASVYDISKVSERLLIYMGKKEGDFDEFKDYAEYGTFHESDHKC